MLNVDGLSTAYRRGRPVLRSLSLSLPEASVGVVLGPNGCGKTTLFKTILGIVAPSAGSVTFDGEDLLAMPRSERARRVAWVPQDIRFGALSVWDSVLTGRVGRFGLRAGAEDHKAAEAALREMGLLELSERNTEELSGGERQKVAIARALCQEPKLMIFDEPTGNLDIAGEERLLRTARRLAGERGISVLCSLHDLNQALAVGDRFYFMKNGSIHTSGGSECFTAETIRRTYGIQTQVVEIGQRKIILGGTIQ